MKQIDEARLESDTQYRVAYLSEFMNFTPDDVAAIHGAASLLGPVVPALVDAVYVQLQRRDATWRHFVPWQFGYEGPVPSTLADVTIDHDLILFRKQHLIRYLVNLVTKPFDAKMVAYLDMVGKIHTPTAGAAEIAVPLVQMNALLGFVADALIAAVYAIGLAREQEMRTVRAFNKLLWLQNDLINRHYQAALEVAASRVVVR